MNPDPHKDLASRLKQARIDDFRGELCNFISKEACDLRARTRMRFTVGDLFKTDICKNLRQLSNVKSCAQYILINHLTLEPWWCSRGAGSTAAETTT